MVIVVLQLLAWFVVPLVMPDAMIVGVLGGLVGGMGIVAWWVFFSRAPWSERLGAVVVIIGAVLATRPLMHPSIQTGMMGKMFFVYAVPLTLSLAFVAWAVVSRRLAVGPRRLAMVAAILAGCSVWALVRTNGISGGGGADLAWRWTETAEERLLAQGSDAPTAVISNPGAAATSESQVSTGVGKNPSGLPTPASAANPPDHRPRAGTGNDPATVAEVPAALEPAAEWPGFRGPDRDDVIRGVRIRTDWATSPPVELWRRPIGPGWSSFAVQGDLLYTQEQRGDDEVVSCYKLTTGKPVWMHRDGARFWESNGGAGPRATPTLHNGRVYSFGATGILNALNASDGVVAWSRDVAQDNGVKAPGWGFAGSPLVFDDVVIVAASGALVGYDLDTGDRRWFVPSRGGGYSSPHLVSIDGAAQVLLMGGSGITSFVPKDGARLWESAWEGVPIVQPAVVSGGDLLISSADMMGGMGTRRIKVAHEPGGWVVEERWTSRGLKPYFNDLVVHKGHAFGFDGSILSCIDLEDGKRKWKGGRYGNGQMLLLAEQDLLLVLSEDGELALVGASIDQFTEIARFAAIEGKTWNHPVMVGDVLLVRNGQEMVAFRLALDRRLAQR
ncbi:MAG: PQQ-like beta-propeller repeat protein [Vicinamibacteria bacterium]|nr:PQQ-like beta-propeller repeat protein [Vicinamibacteria bacterium]